MSIPGERKFQLDTGSNVVVVESGKTCRKSVRVLAFRV
jgi:hypothetical protein